jgi:formate-dependent phosphoribosylglycinamide formyltransferase (GAR transformylase)
MRTALLVDTGFSALPLLEALRKLNLQVHVVGSRASDALVEAADVYHELDYADVAAMQRLMDQHNFQYVVPGCTDKSYEVCASIQSMRCTGIDSPENTKSVNDKLLFREILRDIGIPAPRHYSDNKIGDVGGPLIVKPVDSFSGQGISVIDVDHLTNLPEAIKYARSFSRSGDAIVEDFIFGQLYSYSCFVRGGCVSVGFFVKEDCERSKFSVDTSVVQGLFPNSIARKIKRDIESIVSYLGLVDGLFHTQFILNEDDYWILEATRRCPGDLYSILIQLSTQFDYAGAYVSTFVDCSEHLDQPVGSRGTIVRHTLAGQGSDYLSYWSSVSGLRIIRCYPVTACGSKWSKDRPNRCAIIFVDASELSGGDEVYRRISSGIDLVAR